MKTKIVHLVLALALMVALSVAIVPASPVQAQSSWVVLDDFEGGSGLTWFYYNDPLPEGDGCHEGGLGQTPGDTSTDGSGLLEIVGGELQWTFDGSYGIAGTSTCKNGASWFDLILPLDGADWSGYKAIKFDITTTRTGGSDRDYLRVDVKLDEVGSEPGNYFNEEDEVWSAHKLDVGYGSPIPDNKHSWLGGCEYDPGADPPDYCVGIQCPDGVWPQPEFGAERTGWSTFELNFDQIKDSRGGWWANPGQYDCGNDWRYDKDVCGETLNPGWDGIIDRDNLESYRFMISFFSPRWIGPDETITVYFDNIELLAAEGGNGNGDGGGCFIATAAYGSYLDSHVETLRDFRDSYLVTNPVGQALVSAYYKVSPPVAEFMDDHPALKPIVRVGLLPAVALSEVAVNTTPTQKTGIVGSLALVSVALAVWLSRRQGKGAIS